MVAVVVPVVMLTGWGSAGLAVTSYEVAPVPRSVHFRSTPVDPFNVPVQEISGGYGLPWKVALLGTVKIVPATTTEMLVIVSSPVEFTENVRLPLQGEYMAVNQFAVRPEKLEVLQEYLPPSSLIPT
jgi:hypothetical protein